MVRINPHFDIIIISHQYARHSHSKYSGKNLDQTPRKASLNKGSFQQELLLLLENSVQARYNSSVQISKILALREEMAQYVISNSNTDRIREERDEL